MGGLLAVLSLAGILPGLLMAIFCFSMTQNETAAFVGFFVGAALGMFGGLWSLYAMRDSLVGWGAE